MSLQAHSHGAELRRCELDGIRIAEVVTPGRLELRRHAHPTGQVVFVLEGDYRERWRRSEARLGPGSVIFRPPGEPHANHFGDEEVLALVVAYEPGRLARLAAVAEPLRLPALLADLRERILVELAREDAVSSYALEGLALLLLSRVGRLAPEQRWPGYLREALSLIESGYARPLTLGSLATAVGAHRATLAAAFRRHLDRSVGEVVREVRVRHALEALGRTRRPLAEIALDCGFYDQSHMGRLVKRSTGLAPAEVRARR
jgi:AraC family transcriptional regulator